VVAKVGSSLVELAKEGAGRSGGLTVDADEGMAAGAEVVGGEGGDGRILADKDGASAQGFVGGKGILQKLAKSDRDRFSGGGRLPEQVAEEMVGGGGQVEDERWSAQGVAKDTDRGPGITPPVGAGRGRVLFERDESGNQAKGEVGDGLAGIEGVAVAEETGGKPGEGFAPGGEVAGEIVQPGELATGGFGGAEPLVEAELAERFDEGAGEGGSRVFKG